MYGTLPTDLGLFDVQCLEMLFYQYLPIKMVGQSGIDNNDIEPRLQWSIPLIGTACCDYIANAGLNQFVDSYVYLTAKHMWQHPGQSFNREGWHSDGFMTDDYNYIWSDCCPTIFNTSEFDISPDDERSLYEMAIQAKPKNNIVYANKHLLRLTQDNIHKVGPIDEGTMRTFVKISISKDKYDLIGNAVNPRIACDWEMRERIGGRNIPQKL